MKRYYRKQWYMMFIMPFYNFMTFWFRFAGIINSIKGEQSWKTLTLTQEMQKVKELISKDFRYFITIGKKIKRKVTTDQDND